MDRSLGAHTPLKVAFKRTLKRLVTGYDRLSNERLNYFTSSHMDLVRCQRPLAVNSV